MLNVFSSSSHHIPYCNNPQNKRKVVFHVLAASPICVSICTNLSATLPQGMTRILFFLSFLRIPKNSQMTRVMIEKINPVCSSHFKDSKDCLKVIMKVLITIVCMSS